MEFFILLLVLGLLSGMVFTFVKACQVVSLEQKVRTLETEVAGLKERPVSYTHLTLPTIA